MLLLIQPLGDKTISNQLFRREVEDNYKCIKLWVLVIDLSIHVLFTAISITFVLNM